MCSIGNAQIERNTSHHTGEAQLNLKAEKFLSSNFHRKEIAKLTFRALVLRRGELHRTWSFYVVVSQRSANEFSKIKTALVGRVERAEVMPNQLINYADHAANQSCIFITFLNFPPLHSKCGPPCLNSSEGFTRFIFLIIYLQILL